MIIDKTIDEETARYFCVVDKDLIESAMKNAKRFAQDNSTEKLGIQTAIALGPKPSVDANLNESGRLDENWFTDLLDATPAWVEEPTGFNLASPKDVFKDDPEGGVAGWKRGAKMGAVASIGAIGVAIPPVRNAALKIGKSLTKFAVKHPKTMAAASIAATNPTTTYEIGKNLVKDVKQTKSVLGTLRSAFEKVCGWFKPLTNYFKDHPLYASAIGAIGYGLLRSYPIWWPYIRRLGYELTSGGILAKVNFDANGTNWTFEYSSSKNKWILLNAGRIASPEDSVSFSQTRFSKEFIKQCEKNFDALFKYKNVVLAQAQLVGGEKLKNKFADFIDDEQSIRSNMFRGKILFEHR